MLSKALVHVAVGLVLSSHHSSDLRSEHMPNSRTNTSELHRYLRLSLTGERLTELPGKGKKGKASVASAKGDFQPPHPNDPAWVKASEM